MHITPLYAALLALLFIYLSIRVVKARGMAKVSIGDGGNLLLQRAIAAHSNFAQYVPLSLLLMALMEMQQAPAALLHAFGLTLLVSRALHAYGVSQLKENFGFRKVSMLTTFGLMGAAALYLLGLAAYRAICV